MSLTLKKRMKFLILFTLINTLIPENNTPYASRRALCNQIPFTQCKNNSFFPAVKSEWKNLDISICNSSSCHILKNLILKFISPEPKRISSTQNFEGNKVKLLTRMRLGLSHLADQPIINLGIIFKTA